MKYKLFRHQDARLANDCRRSVWLLEGLAKILLRTALNTELLLPKARLKQLNPRFNQQDS